MNKKISRIIGLAMAVIAIVFVVFALNHPEMSFPWSNTITWVLCSLYAIVTAVLLIAPINCLFCPFQFDEVSIQHENS